ncbi:MAG: hypothetical protein EA401_02390 [Planctomycetota bacterium]|nr:MAG: hypothetical protein EA401_02390 [Planctomycetota bacterium]
MNQSPVLLPLVFLLLMSVLAIGCGMRVTKLTDQRFPAVEPSQVQIMRTQPTHRRYLELAILADTGEFSNHDKLLNKIRIKAAEMGADAIIITQMGTQTQTTGGMGVTNPYTGITTYSTSTSSINVVEAVAIKWQ